MFSFFATASVNRSLFPDGLANEVMPIHVGDRIPEDHTPSGSPIEVVELSFESVPGNFAETLAAGEKKIKGNA